MRKGGGKAKGSAFERQIAKDIVKAFAKFGITQRDCWRSINSGGHVVACGDLEMSEKLIGLFNYAVECKFRKKIQWKNFLLRDWKTEEMKWITQAREASFKDLRLRPILVLKENFGPIYVLEFFKPHEMYEVSKWTTFIKNVVEECNSRKGKPRATQRRLSSGRT